MSLLEFSSNNIEKILFFYQSKTLQDLQTIKPKWAYGRNSKKALYDFNEDYEIFLVKTEELISNAEMYEVNTKVLFTGIEINDQRIVKILHHWDNDKFIDPPTIGICNINPNKVSFSDGRHRAKVAHFLKYLKIPVLVYKPDKNKINKILNLEILF